MTPARSWWSELGSPLFLVLLFLLSLPAVTPRLNASDEIQYFAWLRSAAFDRDADFENEYRYFYDSGAVRNPGFRETFLERVNENGRRHNFAPIGSALLWAPFYGAGHLAAGLLGMPQDGYSSPYIRAVTGASAFYGLMALLLSGSIARRILGGRSGAVVAIWIGTPLLFYMYVAPGFAHACSAFAVALFLWTWLRVRRDWTAAGCLQLGLSGALVAMVREQDLFFLAGPACDFVAWWIWQRPDRATREMTDASASHHRRAIVGAIVGLGACALAYAPQLYAYTALNGHPGPDATVQNKMTWTSPHLAGVLFSPEHGLFVWTPLALVAVIGLIRLAASPRLGGPDARWIGFLALVMLLLQAYISGSVESWTVAGSFGQRRFVSLTPLLVLGLAALTARPAEWHESRAARPANPSVIALALIAVAVWWNLGLMAQFGLHLMDRQRLTPRENARVTFLELPRQAPAIAWRYLTDRESFYRLPRRAE
jgi:hypothetical protein